MHSKWSGPTVAYIDMLFTLAIIFIAMSILSPQAKPTQDAAMDKPICMMAIDIDWDGTLRSDVDLWVKDPGDEKSIGFSNAHGMYADLVRDDLGSLVDLNGRHSERTCIRGIVDGSYTIGVDLFRHESGEVLPIQVHVLVSIVDLSSATLVHLYDGTVTLDATRQEETAINFVMSRGQLVAGSLDHIPNPIKGYQ